MRNRNASRRWSMSLATLLLISGLTAMAVDGRDFAGVYKTSNELESGENVTMTFDVEIFNFSGADVLGATVRLHDPLDAEEPRATWVAVDIPDRDRCTLTAAVTVPVRERDEWRKGAMPRLTVENQDASGVMSRERVALAFGPVLREEGQ